MTVEHMLDLQARIFYVPTHVELLSSNDIFQKGVHMATRNNTLKDIKAPAFDVGVRLSIGAPVFPGSLLLLAVKNALRPIG